MSGRCADFRIKNKKPRASLPGALIAKLNASNGT